MSEVLSVFREFFEVPSGFDGKALLGSFFFGMLYTSLALSIPIFSASFTINTKVGIYQLNIIGGH